MSRRVSKLRAAWYGFLCYLTGHHDGDAAHVGLVPGVVCYRCGARLHRCHGAWRGGRHG